MTDHMHYNNIQKHIHIIIHPWRINPNQYFNYTNKIKSSNEINECAIIELRADADKTVPSVKKKSTLQDVSLLYQSLML